LFGLYLATLKVCTFTVKRKKNKAKLRKLPVLIFTDEKNAKYSEMNWWKERYYGVVTFIKIGLRILITS